MTTESKTPELTLWKEARLADRVQGVQERHRHKSEALSAFDPMLLTTAHSYLDHYRRLVGLESNARAAQRALRQRVRSVVGAMRRWSAHLSRDIPGWSAAEYTTSSVAADVVLHTRHMIELAAARGTEGAGALPYFDALASELSSLIAPLRDAIQTQMDLQATLQERRAATRAAAGEFHRQLVAYRRVLRLVLGPHHHDYHALRENRIRREDAMGAIEPDVSAAEAPPLSVEGGLRRT